MTFLQKFEQDHPDITDDISCYDGCPDMYGYETHRGFSSHCAFTTCRDCWNRQMDGSLDICTANHNTNNEREETTMENTYTTRKTKAQLLEEIDGLKRQVADLDRYRQYESCANELANIREAFVKAGFSELEAVQIILAFLPNGGR